MKDEPMNLDHYAEHFAAHRNGTLTLEQAGELLSDLSFLQSEHTILYEFAESIKGKPGYGDAVTRHILMRNRCKEFSRVIAGMLASQHDDDYTKI